MFFDKELEELTKDIRNPVIGGAPAGIGRLVHLTVLNWSAYPTSPPHKTCYFTWTQFIAIKMGFNKARQSRVSAVM